MKRRSSTGTCDTRIVVLTHRVITTVRRSPVLTCACSTTQDISIPRLVVQVLISTDTTIAVHVVHTLVASALSPAIGVAARSLLTIWLGFVELNYALEGRHAETANTLAAVLALFADRVITTRVSRKKTCHRTRSLNTNRLLVPDFVAVVAVIAATLVTVVVEHIRAYRTEAAVSRVTGAFNAGCVAVRDGVSLEFISTFAQHSGSVSDVHA